MLWVCDPPHLDEDGVEGHLRGVFGPKATEQLQGHVHLPPHTTAHVGHQGAHHLLSTENHTDQDGPPDPKITREPTNSCTKNHKDQDGPSGPKAVRESTTSCTKNHTIRRG